MNDFAKQVYDALDNAEANQHPHEYNLTAESQVRQIHDWSGIEGFDHDSADHMASAVKGVVRWRTDNPPKGLQ